MADEDWGRPHYQPNGGDAMVAFWVFGDIAPDGLQISASKHRVRQPPPGLGIARMVRGTPEGDEAFETFTDAASSYMGKSLDEKPELAAAVRGSKVVMRLLAEVPDPADLIYLRTIVGIVQAMMEVGGVAVCDQALHWWSKKEWESDVFGPDAPEPSTFVALLGSENEEGEGLWLHTRGMRAFGRPDISVRGVTDQTQEVAADLVMRLVNMQVQGAVVPEGQAVRMKGIPAGWVCSHRGSLDDPDYNNVHIAIGPRGNT